MAWTVHFHAGYLLALTDGYRVSNVAEHPASDENRRSADRAIAERLYEFGKGTHRSPAKLAAISPVPNPLHIWIARPLPASMPSMNTLNRLAEGDNDAHYRIVIVGADLQPERENLCGDWFAALRHAGIRAKKSHADTLNWKRNATFLLRRMADHYLHYDEPPHPPLANSGLEFAFFGDVRSAEPSHATGRTQQYDGIAFTR